VKVSEFILQYIVSGELPTADQKVAYWAGWLIGAARKHHSNSVVMSKDLAKHVALECAEFLEDQQ
jgi:hypothetical protein